MPITDSQTPGPEYLLGHDEAEAERLTGLAMWRSGDHAQAAACYESAAANLAAAGYPGRAAEALFYLANERFGSWHTGVCQFVMCDGSVRALSNNIRAAINPNLKCPDLNAVANQGPLHRLAVYNDGQVIVEN